MSKVYHEGEERLNFNLISQRTLNELEFPFSRLIDTRSVHIDKNVFILYTRIRLKIVYYIIKQ